MTEFVDVVASFPAVVLTVLLAVSVGYWIVVTVTGLGDGGFDLDTDTDVDVGDGSVALLDLHLMPVSMTMTVVSLVGWVVAVLASILIGSWVDGLVGLLLDVVVLVVAIAVGVVAAGRVARVVAPLFGPSPTAGHRDLVGRICTVRTGRVDGGFGQAEVVDGQGGSHLIQVRCHEPNELASGDRALVVHLDGEVFVISADVDALG